MTVNLATNSRKRTALQDMHNAAFVASNKTKKFNYGDDKVVFNRETGLGNDPKVVAPILGYSICPVDMPIILRLLKNDAPAIVPILTPGYSKNANGQLVRNPNLDHWNLLVITNNGAFEVDVPGDGKCAWHTVNYAKQISQHGVDQFLDSHADRVLPIRALHKQTLTKHGIGQLPEATALHASRHMSSAKRQRVANGFAAIPAQMESAQPTRSAQKEISTAEKVDALLARQLQQQLDNMGASYAAMFALLDKASAEELKGLFAIAVGAEPEYQALLKQYTADEVAAFTTEQLKDRIALSASINPKLEALLKANFNVSSTQAVKSVATSRCKLNAPVVTTNSHAPDTANNADDVFNQFATPIAAA